MPKVKRMATSLVVTIFTVLAMLGVDTASASAATQVDLEITDEFGDTDYKSFNFYNAYKEVQPNE